MEPIPEDPEFGSPSRTLQTSSVLREVFRSEKIENRQRRVPANFLYCDTDQQSEAATPVLSSAEVMQSHDYFVSSPSPSRGNVVTVEEEGGIHGSSYSYEYESSYDQPPRTNLLKGPASPAHDPDQYEHHTTSSQKVTRLTKVTTTKTVEEIPTHGQALYDQPPENEYSIGNGDRLHNASFVSNGTNHYATLSDANTSIEFQPHSVDFVTQYAVPSAPGIPTVASVEASEVGLVWLRPDQDGDGGHLEGYQVQLRRNLPNLPWAPAHADLIPPDDTQCTVSGLEEGAEYEFRVVARNRSGFGAPSTPSAPVALRAHHVPITSADPTHAHHTQQQEPLVPYPPGRPRVVAMDGVGVELEWEEPIFPGRGGPVQGYAVEYRPTSSDLAAAPTATWLPANDQLVPDTACAVSGLRPNGEYEFRVTAKNVEGYSEGSQTSGPIRIRPAAPPRSPGPQRNGYGTTPPPPGAPEASAVDSDSVTLSWAPPPGIDPAAVHGYVLEQREMGDPDWYEVTPGSLIPATAATVAALRPNGTFEFRVAAETTHGLSEPSALSQLVQLRPRLHGGRGVPQRPSPPELLEEGGDQVTLCWLPVASSPPLHGYDMEFRDLSESPEWFKLNEILMSNCRMTIGDLSSGHTYEFRVIAKNSLGYSEPSQASVPIIVGAEPGASYGYAQPNGGNPQLERELSNISDGLARELNVRESPPLPDRDDSPPPIHRFDQGQDGVTWRDPTLTEVLEYLSSSNDVQRLNAAGYLQHLIFHDPEMKRKTRELGGIPRLLALLRSESPEIQKNASGCLRNLAFGPGSDEAKRTIAGQGGVAALTHLLRNTPDMQVKEEITGALWNLSSSDELKQPMLGECLEPLVSQVIVPSSGWCTHPTSNGHGEQSLAYNPQVFRNATGLLRNISALGETGRRRVREMPDLVDALVHFLAQSVRVRKEYDSKTVENVVCVLRNLSYRCQEVEDPNYDKNPPHSGRDSARSRSAPSGSPKVKSKKEKSGLFGKKKKDDSKAAAEATRGVALLWQPSIVPVYLALLQNAANPETLEAAAGAVQNLAACYWQPSVEIRTAVRREKGLPIFVDLLSVPEPDKVLVAVATAMRNLALDPHNRDLIGQYAMPDLANRLPVPGQAPPRNAPSNAALAAVLGVLYETVLRSPDFTKRLHECNGTERLIYITRSPQAYSSRVIRYASQVLHAMWEHRELSGLWAKAGLKEADFALRNVRSVATAPGDTHTLGRPISTQGQERLPNSSRLRPDLYDSTPSTARSSQPHSHNGSASSQQTSGPVQAGSERRRIAASLQGQHFQHANPRPHSHHMGSAYGEELYAQVQKRGPPPGPPLYAVPNPSGPHNDSWV